jgi:hypothetical protein
MRRTLAAPVIRLHRPELLRNSNTPTQVSETLAKQIAEGFRL